MNSICIINKYNIIMVHSTNYFRYTKQINIILSYHCDYYTYDIKM